MNKLLKNLIGEKFGDLEVISLNKIEQKTTRKTCFWNCKCICGSTVVIPTPAFCNGSTTNCGCRYSEMKTRTCRKCLVEKDLNEINFQPHRINGKLRFYHECLVCKRLRTNLYDSKNRDKINNKRKIYTELRKSLGLCVACNSTLCNNNRKYCEEHWFKDVSQRNLGTAKHWKQIKQKLIDQDYKCAYSGRLLKPGDNASLDHIIPRNKDRSLETDVNNAQWVDFTINRMKTDLLEEDFLDIISDIYTNRIGVLY